MTTSTPETVERPANPPSARLTCSAAVERETPAEVLAIVREIEAQEEQAAKMWAEAGLEPSALDAETQTWWNLERAWTRWAGRQTNETLAGIIRAIAGWYFPRTENHALLIEAAERLTKERPKRRRQNTKLRHGAKTQTHEH